MIQPNSSPAILELECPSCGAVRLVPSELIELNGTGIKTLWTADVLLQAEIARRNETYTCSACQTKFRMDGMAYFDVSYAEEEE